MVSRKRNLHVKGVDYPFEYILCGGPGKITPAELLGNIIFQAFGVIQVKNTVNSMEKNMPGISVSSGPPCT